MPVLQTTEYDASYFDGRSQAMAHNAGYSSYKRWKRHDGVDSLGEYWLDKAKAFFDLNNVAGLKILEIGCAKGFMVQDLNDLGADAYGLDVSDYAINTSPDSATTVRPDLASKFYVGDMRTALAQFKRNEFDVVFSLRTLECIDDADLPDLIDEMNRICRQQQIHVIDEFTGETSGTGSFYNQHTLDEWLAMGFENGTVLTARERLNDIRVK